MSLKLDLLRAANVLRNKIWDPESRLTPMFSGCELAGEVGEALNVLKKMERERLGIAGSRATKTQMAEELADVIICADLLAMRMDIDLADAVIRKFNATTEKHQLGVYLSGTGMYGMYGMAVERAMNKERGK